MSGFSICKIERPVVVVWYPPYELEKIIEEHPIWRECASSWGWNPCWILPSEGTTPEELVAILQRDAEPFGGVEIATTRGLAVIHAGPSNSHLPSVFGRSVRAHPAVENCSLNCGTNQLVVIPKEGVVLDSLMRDIEILAGQIN